MSDGSPSAMPMKSLTRSYNVGVSALGSAVDADGTTSTRTTVPSERVTPSSRRTTPPRTVPLRTIVSPLFPVDPILSSAVLPRPPVLRQQVVGTLRAVRADRVRLRLRRLGPLARRNQGVQDRPRP